MKLNLKTFTPEEMEAAVKEFQAANDLEVDGQVTGETAHALNRLVREYLAENDPQYQEAVKLLVGATND